MTQYYAARCPSCQAGYMIDIKSVNGLTRFLALRPRCIAERNGELCGTPIVRSTFSALDDRNLMRVKGQELLGYRVTRKGLLNDAQTTKAAAEAKQAYEQRIAELEAEVARLKEKYETPCPGLVTKYHFEQGNPVRGVVPCGGFLGHPGDCAEVW